MVDKRTIHVTCNEERCTTEAPTHSIAHSFARAFNDVARLQKHVMCDRTKSSDKNQTQKVKLLMRKHINTGCVGTKKKIETIQIYGMTYVSTKHTIHIHTRAQRVNVRRQTPRQRASFGSFAHWMRMPYAARMWEQSAHKYTCIYFHVLVGGSWSSRMKLLTKCM